MSSLLDDYVDITGARQSLFRTCMRTNGPVEVGPTNAGKAFVRWYGKDLITGVSIEGLTLLRDTIDAFLTEVVGEP